MDVKDEDEESSETVFKKEESSLNGADSKGEKLRRYEIGNRAANSLKQKETQTRPVTELTKAAKQKSDMIEERNGITVFTRPEITDRPKAKKFFEALARAHLARAVKRARGEKEDSGNYGKAVAKEDERNGQVTSLVEPT